MARLSLVHAQLVNRDPQAADSARQAILERYSIETTALQRYAQRHGDDPEHMRVIWEAISDLTLALDSAAKAEAESPDATGTPAAAQTDEGGAP